MVRCKSLVESTRVVIVEVMSKEAEVEDETPTVDNSGAETDDMDADMEHDWDPDEDSHNMVCTSCGTAVPLFFLTSLPYSHLTLLTFAIQDVAKVYENTIVQLGELLLGGTAYDFGSIQS